MRRFSVLRSHNHNTDILIKYVSKDICIISNLYTSWILSFVSFQSVFPWGEFITQINIWLQNNNADIFVLYYIFRIRNLWINEDWFELADTLNQIILRGVSQPLELELLVGGGKVGKVATPPTATQSRPPTPPNWPGGSLDVSNSWPPCRDAWHLRCFGPVYVSQAFVCRKGALGLFVGRPFQL